MPAQVFKYAGQSFSKIFKHSSYFCFLILKPQGVILAPLRLSVKGKVYIPFIK